MTVSARTMGLVGSRCAPTLLREHRAGWENPMKIAVIGLLVSLAFASSSLAQDVSTFPAQAACGPMNVEFRIKSGNQPPIPQVQPGKALVYVVEEQKFRAFNDVTARMGLDGVWVGANRGNSYLFFSVEPGEHHLCTDWISDLLPNHRLVSVANFTAEPGKSYYFRVRTSGGPSSMARSGDAATIDLDLINTDEGKLLVSMSSFSASEPKKQRASK